MKKNEIWEIEEVTEKRERGRNKDRREGFKSGGEERKKIKVLIIVFLVWTFRDY